MAFEAIKVYGKGQTVSRFKVFKGAENTVKVGFTEDLIVSVPRGMAGKLTVRLDSRQPLLSPVHSGAQVGTLKLMLGGQAWGEYPVVALEEVPLAGFFGRLWDTLVLWFK